MFRNLSYAAIAFVALLLTGCAAQPQRNVDYSAFRESKPASILVLPPLNASVDPAATVAVLAQATLPLAESGYYVVPVGVMNETFRENGLDSPEDIHEVSPAKLREIFGADAALYLTVTQYGSSYRVLTSSITVAIDAALIDLRTGTKLWDGNKSITQSGNGGGNSLIGMLAQAIVDQMVNNLSDRSFGVAGLTSRALLSASRPGGMPYGPRSPHYEFQ